jgi:lipopolysaccharide biosynthesis regulator YciM
MKTLQQIDAEIAQLEQQLAVLHEQRREWVNHLDLNKRVIRVTDFVYVWGVHHVTCRHVPTSKTTTRDIDSFKPDADDDSWPWARELIVAELLAEGWVYAS